MQDICRICHCEGEAESFLISPCYCSGSMCYVHQSCLQQWIMSSGTQSCELCKFQFIIHRKIKPFREWKGLDMSPEEQRKFVYFIICLVFTIMYVLWILYKSTLVEKKVGLWMHLTFDLMGFIGALILVCMNGNKCGKLFRSWKAFNSIIYVKNARQKRGIVQQLAAVFSAADHMTAGILTSKENKRLSPDEDELHSCQSDSNNHIGSSNGVAAVAATDANSPSGNMPTSEKDSTKTTQTSMTNSGLVLVGDQYHPLSEVVVISTTTDSAFSTSGKNPLPFSPESFSKEPTANGLQINAKIF